MSERSPQPNLLSREHIFQFPVKFWLLVLLSGIGAGLAGGLLMRLFHAVQHIGYRYHTGEEDYLAAVARVSGARRIACLVLAGVLAAAVRVFLKLTRVPKATDLSESIWFHSGRLPLVSTCVRGLLSIVSVALGVPLGREGALKQTGAALASSLSDRAGLHPAHRRLLVACAAGAGMAAAYNVPFGGALFAAEVLLGTLALPAILPALATSLLATGVSWLLLPNEPTYHIPVYKFQTPDAIWACLAAPIFGLVAVAWVRVVAWADQLKPKARLAYFAPLAGFLLVGLASVSLPDLLGNGKGLVQRTYAGELGWQLVAVLLVVKFVAAPGALSTGVPGGLFTPTLTVGALLGGLLGHVWIVAFPHSPLGAFAIIGSVAVLAAATQGPVSAVAFAIELTHHVDTLMVPALLAIVGASLVTQRFERRSVYSARIEEGMRAGAKIDLHGTAFDQYATSNYSVATAAATLTTVQERLLTGDDPLFVLDNTGRYLGQLSRSTLLHATANLPASLLTAGDIAQTSDVLHADTDLTAARSHLQAATSALPVVCANSGKFQGAALWQTVGHD